MDAMAGSVWTVLAGPTAQTAEQTPSFQMDACLADQTGAPTGERKGACLGTFNARVPAGETAASTSMMLTPGIVDCQINSTRAQAGMWRRMRWRLRQAVVTPDRRPGPARRILRGTCLGLSSGLPVGETTAGAGMLHLAQGSVNAVCERQAPAAVTRAPASHPHVPAGETAAGTTRLASGLVIVKRSISDDMLTGQNLAPAMPDRRADRLKPAKKDDVSAAAKF